MTAPVLVIDFGSQVTQLIARRVREAGVYCEIVPFNKAEEALAKRHAASDHPLRRSGQRHRRAIRPRAPQEVFELGVPVLGICYGEMAMAQQLGGKVEGGHNREFGRADIEIDRQSAAARRSGRCGGSEPVWMSHGDKSPRCRRASMWWRQRESALRGDRRRDAPLLRRDVPSRSRAHAARRALLQEFRASTSPASSPTGT